MYNAIFVLFSPKTNIIGFIIKFLIALPALILFFNTDRKYVDYYFRFYSGIIYGIALLSLVFYFFTTIIPVIPAINTIIVSWQGDSAFKNYFYLYFSANYSYFGSFLRNTAIFSEAPQFGLQLTITFAYEMFFSKKFSLHRLVIISIAILSTVSIGSIITMLCVLFAKYLVIRIDNKYLRVLRILLSFLVLGVIVSSILLLFFIKINTGSSFKIRVDDFLSGFDSWKSHPIFGNGYGNDEIIKQFAGSFRSWSIENNVYGFSNSIAMILSNGGIYLFSMYIIPAILFIKSNVADLYSRLVFLLVILLMLIFNPFAYNVIIINMISISYSLSVSSIPKKSSNFSRRRFEKK